MNKDLMFSSKKEDWGTPEAFYQELNLEFNFTLDPCADEVNHKCNNKQHLPEKFSIYHIITH